MKSKSFECPKNQNEKVTQNKTFDFINYYEPATENSIKLLQKHKSDKNNETTSRNKSHVSKREHSPNKKKKLKDNSVNISKISIDGSNLPHSSKDDPKVTSTPNVKAKKDVSENFKSIMKNSSATNDSLETSTVSVSKNKPKKRNKSVSFMLEESEGITIKRSKSDLSVADIKSPQNSRTKLGKDIQKKAKKKFVNGKENKVDGNNIRVENDTSDNVKLASTKQKSKTDNMQTSATTDIPMPEKESKSKYEKKKYTKLKKPKQVETSPNQEIENTKPAEDVKGKKVKKKKRPATQVQENTGTEGEPVTKSSKKEIKPDIIVQDLQNLSIGDNAHTLTNLLDEMTVVDKKKKKNKNKVKKHKKDIPGNTSYTPTDSNEPKSEEKEKVKWMKRKWNKDKKGGVNDDKLSTSVVIENLPLKIMCSYKKLLTEHFVKFGIIKLVGIAEVYSIEHPEVFTTTINFESEEAANKALEEDNTLFEGNRIRVKRPLPPSQTTLVVRSYAELSEPALSSVFISAGRIRNVRRLVKGKKSMGTAFIEFDGPEAVMQAIKMAEDVKIGGKKIFAAKFEIRNINKTKKLKRDREADNDAGSDDSSD